VPEVFPLIGWAGEEFRLDEVISLNTTCKQDPLLLFLERKFMSYALDKNGKFPYSYRKNLK